MQYEVLSLIVISSVACFAAIGGWLAQLKNRSPLEGVILGAFLGPIGVLIEFRMRFVHRPMVDRGAWNSFRSLVSYQSDQEILRLPARSSQASRRPLKAAKSRRAVGRVCLRKVKKWIAA